MSHLFSLLKLLLMISQVLLNCHYVAPFHRSSLRVRYAKTPQFGSLDKRSRPRSLHDLLNDFKPVTAEVIKEIAPVKLEDAL